MLSFLVKEFIKQPKSREGFVHAVMSRLPEIPEYRDRLLVEMGIRGHFVDGWLVSDSVAYWNVREEVNPDYPEATAITIQARISTKYYPESRAS